MYIGTTPLIEAELDSSIELSTIEKLYATFEQNNALVFEKSLDDGVTLENDKVLIQLTQKDTLKLRPGIPLFMQIKFKQTDGTVSATDIEKFVVKSCLKEGEI